MVFTIGHFLHVFRRADIARRDVIGQEHEGHIAIRDQLACLDPLPVIFIQSVRIREIVKPKQLAYLRDSELHDVLLVYGRNFAENAHGDEHTNLPVEFTGRVWHRR